MVPGLLMGLPRATIGQLRDGPLEMFLGGGGSGTCPQLAQFCFHDYCLG